MPVLGAVRPYQLNPRQFRHGIGPVGFLKRAGHEVFFFKRLLCIARVNTAGTKEDQSADFQARRSGDDIGFNLQVIGHEIGRMCRIIHDPANARCGQENDIRFMIGHPVGNIGLTAQVQLRLWWVAQDIGFIGFQAAGYSGPYHTA